MSISRFLLPTAASLALASFVFASEEPTFEQRLERLAKSLESAREKVHVPGMSIAIVKKDQVVWARGFGFADVASETPADENTIYAIGSTTKAFTSTLVGMLVEEEKATWDDPVTNYLPYFDLQVRSDDEAAECTLRDLLSHRHGFTRMGVLWLNSGVSREEILRTAAGAEPWDDFRENFHYCNVTYLAAGEAAGVAADSTWDEMMAERLFKPLGMNSSTLSVSQVAEDPRLALGYRWEKTGEELEHRKMVSLDAIGPAGSVNSNVIDMAQWLRFQLANGDMDGTRLIAPEHLLETRKPQIEIAGGVSYGLGWMLREHNGRQIVEHGGNIDGFSAEVAFMPEEQLGYVLLMNLDNSPLRIPSLQLVFDALLEEGQDEVAAPSTEEVDLKEYTGIYVANFAAFRDEEFEVSADEDRLTLNVPSQRDFELDMPNAEGQWSFAITDQVAVSFQRNAQGAVVGLTMHQGGYNFEVPRKGIPILATASAEELEKYVGTYVRAEGGKRMRISIVHGLLTMEDKGMRLPFRSPDAEGHAPLRARPEQGATFTMGAEGHAESLIFHGNAGDKLFTLVPETADSELPTPEEVLALRKTEERIAALEVAGATKAMGEVWMAQAGVRGRLTIYTQGKDRFAHHMDFGKFGRIDTVVNPDEAWSYNTLQGIKPLKGEQLTQALLDHPGAVEGDWNDYFDSIEVVRRDIVNTRPVIVVRLMKEGLPSRTYWVDAEQGDVLRMKRIVIEASHRVPVTLTYSKFEEVQGIRAAMQVEIESSFSGRSVLTFTKLESQLELADDVFRLEDPSEEH